MAITPIAKGDGRAIRVRLLDGAGNVIVGGTSTYTMTHALKQSQDATEELVTKSSAIGSEITRAAVDPDDNLWDINYLAADTDPLECQDFFFGAKVVIPGSNGPVTVLHELLTIVPKAVVA